MRAIAILGIIAFVAALGAVTLLIRTQGVSAQQSPSPIDQIERNLADSCLDMGTLLPKYMSNL
jgi:hypothetical protein